MISESLRQKLHSKIGGGDPEKILRQLFGLSSTTELTLDIFVATTTQKLNFVGYEEAVKGLFRRFDVDRTEKIEVLYVVVK